MSPFWGQCLSSWEALRLSGSLRVSTNWPLPPACPGRPGVTQPGSAGAPLDQAMWGGGKVMWPSSEKKSGSTGCWPLHGDGPTCLKEVTFWNCQRSRSPRVFFPLSLIDGKFTMVAASVVGGGCERSLASACLTSSIYHLYICAKGSLIIGPDPGCPWRVQIKENRQALDFQLFRF